MTHFRLVRSFWLLVGCWIPITAWGEGTAPPVNYGRDIKPLLREKCFACHGAWKQESGLRLDTVSAMRRGGSSGPAVEPGNGLQSLLLHRVSTTDLAERMPLEATPLTAEQLGLVRKWIDEGAVGPADEQPDRDPREHWAFRPPQRPALPSEGESARSAPHPIDAFLAVQHVRHGLRPRPAADKSVLLRRVYLDLIGLPPTPDELQAFLADPAPDAYERVVDRLLASPRYGERWGRHWMDIWRYADWYGRRYVPDVWNSAPQIWRWRDWIVRSLNEDKSYAQMLSEMIAADEIAPEDDDAVVATGYLIRNWYALNPNDWMRQNVEHTGKAFLGLTFHCAHCHDHKYDPITQRDYFALRAFFEPIGIRQDRVAGEADPGPFQEYSYSVLRKIVRLGAVRIYDKTPDAPTWLYTGGDERNRVTEPGSIPPGLPAVLEARLAIRPVALPPTASYPGLRPAIQQTILAERHAMVRQREAELAAARATLEQGLPERLRNWERDYEDLAARRQVEVEEGKVEVAFARLRAAEAELASAEKRIAADRRQFASLNGETEPTVDSEAVKLARAAEGDAALAAAVAELAAAQQALRTAEAKDPADPERAAALAAATKQQVAAGTQLQQARAAAADPAPAQPYTPFSPRFPAQSTGRRRALAEWLGNSQNPLTPRVAVNHIWARHFHAPLVTTVFDFGINGAPPTHPELLDWLAVEFVESGWSMQHLHRLIVTSAAYRRSSSTGDESANVERDPENRYLWRQNPGRMEAEVVRDSILACQGHLDLKIGGQELENSEALTTFRRSLYYCCQPESDGKSEFGAIFDAPDPLDCYRRSRSIVPQQALALSNSTLIHSASVAVADRIWAGLPLEQRADPAALVRTAFETVLSRSPQPGELLACLEFVQTQERKQQTRWSESPALRAGLVRVLFNHNDFVTIR